MSGRKLTTGCSGGHPFDYDKQDGESNCYSYRPSEMLDNSQIEGVSQSSVQSDRIVKKRIVHGDVEFPPYIWNTIVDGTHRIAFLLQLLCSRQKRSTGFFFIY